MEFLIECIWKKHVCKVEKEFNVLDLSSPQKDMPGRQMNATVFSLKYLSA